MKTVCETLLCLHKVKRMMWMKSHSTSYVSCPELPKRHAQSAHQSNSQGRVVPQVGLNPTFTSTSIGSGEARVDSSGCHCAVDCSTTVMHFHAIFQRFNSTFLRKVLEDMLPQSDNGQTSLSDCQ